LNLAQRPLWHVSVLKAALLSPTACWLSKCALVLGIGYLFVPVDLIPDRIPVVGHFDEAGFLFGGIVLARIFVPSEFLDRSGQPPRTWLPHLPRGAMPNFFLVGAPQMGTTSLFAALGRHPGVFCCPVKEPNYFSFDLTRRDDALERAQRDGLLIDGPLARILEPPRVGLTTDYQVYLDLFAGWSGQKAIGEASTSYLSSAVAAREIASVAPEARIIIVLRDPVQRSHSDYLTQVEFGHDPGSFRQVVDAEVERIRNGDVVGRGIVASSLYAPQIARYLDHFPRQQILFLLFEDLLADPRRTLELVFEHIGVDPTPARDIELGWENRSGMRRWARRNQTLRGPGPRSTLFRMLPRAVRHGLRPLFHVSNPPLPARPSVPAALEALFRADIARTSRLIGRDLSRWG
jgi:hypothetical protein